MALPDLTGLYIQDTFTNLVVIDDNLLSDGGGTEINTVKNTNLTLTIKDFF